MSFQHVAATFTAHRRAPLHPQPRAHVDATGGSEGGVCSDSNFASLPALETDFEQPPHSPSAAVGGGEPSAGFGIGVPVRSARRRSSRGPISRS